MTSYQYTKSNVYQAALIREIVAAGISKPILVTVEGTTLIISFTNSLTSGQVITLESVVTAHPDLDEYKKMKTNLIDAKTSSMIATGYHYPTSNDTHFSASEPAQINLLYVLVMLHGKMIGDLLEQVKSLKDALTGASISFDKDKNMRDVDPYVWAYLRGLTLPHEMSTHEDDLTIEYQLSDEIDVLKICAQLAGTVLTAYNGGRELKKQIRDATTHAEVDAVVDTR